MKKIITIIIFILLGVSIGSFFATGGIKQVSELYKEYAAKPVTSSSSSSSSSSSEQPNFSTWNSQTNTLTTQKSIFQITGHSSDVSTNDASKDPNSMEGHRYQRLVIINYHYTNLADDDERPYEDWSKHFAVKQSGRTQSVGLQQLYTSGKNVDLSNNAVSFYSKGQSVDAIAHYTYWTDDPNPVTLQITDDNGKVIGELTFSDLPKV